MHVSESFGCTYQSPLDAPPESFKCTTRVLWMHVPNLTNLTRPEAMPSVTCHLTDLTVIISTLAEFLYPQFARTWYEDARVAIIAA